MAPQRRKRTEVWQPDELCQHCRRISVHSLKSPFPPPPPVIWSFMSHKAAEFSGTQGLQHLENARDLRESAQKCELCSVMAEQVLSRFSSWEAVGESPIYLSPPPIYLDHPCSGRSEDNFPYSSENHQTLLGMEVFISTSWLDWRHFGMRFYTDHGKSAFYHSPHVFILRRVTQCPNAKQTARTLSSMSPVEPRLQILGALRHFIGFKNAFRLARIHMRIA